MKTIADTLGVARSNLIEQVQRPPRRRAAYRKADDAWLLPLLRAIVDERPTYGYRRVGALLNRQVVALGKPPVNHDTVAQAHALGLVPCFTPVHSPESNGMAESFVKSFKRDYVFLHRRPDALSVLKQLAAWFDDYNEVRPHRGLRMRSPRQFIRSQLSTAVCPV
jgi:transposase InsO family protein